jgi:hypothetical protein
MFIVLLKVNSNAGPQPIHKSLHLLSKKELMIFYRSALLVLLIAC